MSKTDRVRGQETQLLITKNGNVVREVTAIKSFNGEFEIQVNQQGYLGETADRFDEVYKGFKGDMEFDIDDDSTFGFITDLVARAQRRDAVLFQVNINVSFRFSNGQTRKLQMPNVVFGNIPLKVPDRYSKVSISLSVQCGEAKFKN